MDVYLIRHTRLALASGICYGQSEIELADSFEQEVAGLKALLPQDYDRVYCSPLQRCTSLAQHFKGELQTDARLLEYHFGDWELQPWDDIDNTSLDAWMQDFVYNRPPGGETLVEMASRVNDFIDALRRRQRQRVLIVTHSGVIRCFWAKLLQIPLEQVFKLNVGYASPLRIKLGEDSELDQVFTDAKPVDSGA